MDINMSAGDGETMRPVDAEMSLRFAAEAKPNREQRNGNKSERKYYME